MLPGVKGFLFPTIRQFIIGLGLRPFSQMNFASVVTFDLLLSRNDAVWLLYLVLNASDVLP